MLKAVLIEDNPDDAFLLETALDSSPDVKWDLHTAETLSAGLQAARTVSPDAILLDLSLPDSHGLDTVRKARSSMPHIPLVILTGLEEKSVALEAMRLGAQDFIVKGRLDDQLVIRTILFAIERHRYQAQLDQQEAHLRQLTARFSASFWTTDADLNITSTLGSTFVGNAESTAHSSIYDFFGTRDPSDDIIDAHSRALVGESVGADIHWEGRIFHAQIEPNRTNTDEIIGAMGFAVDVTERRHIEQEFGLARRIQQSLLPEAPPQIPGWDIAGLSRPADATGGDFFDYLDVGENRLTVSVGDVSGHGLGPAILAASAHSYLHALTSTLSDQQEIMLALNRLLIADTPDDQFITMMYVSIDLVANLLHYNGSGHPPLLVFDANGNLKHELASVDPPLGWFDDLKFEPIPPIQIESGDLIVILTDGILEAMDVDHRAFGQDRVVDVVQGSLADSSMSIAGAIYAAAREFSSHASAKDDMTLVVIKREHA